MQDQHSPKNLKFLCRWDPAGDIRDSIGKDKALLKSYCDNLGPSYDIDYEELSINEISSYHQIIEKCVDKTRVIIRHTGHGQTSR